MVDYDDEEARERARLREFHQRHGLSSVPLSYASLEAIVEQGEAENWTTEQYSSALRELIQKATGELVDAQDKPAS